MKRIAGIAAVLGLLAMTLPAGRHMPGLSYAYDETDTIDNDTLDILRDIEVDSVWIDDYVVCDTVVEDYPGEAALQFSVLGESSARLYAGKQFKVKNPDGSEFEYKVNEDGATVTLLRGVANGSNRLVIPAAAEGLNSYFFVTGIADFAFTSHPSFTPEAMAGVKQLVISEGIRWAGESCFQNASDLEYAALPASLENIPPRMFALSQKLKKVNIPEDSHLEKIGWYAFAGCRSLESFYIPERVTEIDDNPWRECTALEGVTLSESNYDFVEQDGVLYSGWQGDLIQYPAGKKDKAYHPFFGTKTIGNAAFCGNPYIERILLPASVDSISSVAFYGCECLKDVVFNGKIQFVGHEAFAACPKLESVTLYGDPSFSFEGQAVTPIEWNKSVIVKKEVPPVKLPQSPGGILSAAWDHVSQMPYFYTEDIKNNKDFGFAEYLGKGKAAVCGNAGPKPDVLHVLEAIPSTHLVLDINEEADRTTRFYLDKSDKKNPRVLYFFGATGGADLVVALFEGGDLRQIEKMIDQAKHGK